MPSNNASCRGGSLKCLMSGGFAQMHDRAQGQKGEHVASPWKRCPPGSQIARSSLTLTKFADIPLPQYTQKFQCLPFPLSGTFAASITPWHLSPAMPSPSVNRHKCDRLCGARPGDQAACLHGPPFDYMNMLPPCKAGPGGPSPHCRGRGPQGGWCITS